MIGFPHPTTTLESGLLLFNCNSALPPSAPPSFRYAPFWFFLHQSALIPSRIHSGMFQSSQSSAVNTIPSPFYGIRALVSGGPGFELHRPHCGLFCAFQFTFALFASPHASGLHLSVSVNMIYVVGPQSSNLSF